MKYPFINVLLTLGSGILEYCSVYVYHDIQNKHVYNIATFYSLVYARDGSSLMTRSLINFNANFLFDIYHL